jgi:hypothetical protein
MEAKWENQSEMELKDCGRFDGIRQEFLDFFEGFSMFLGGV